MNRKLKALLVENGIKQKEIADALGISLAAVCLTINGHCESAPVKRKTAELLNMDANRLNRIWRRRSLTD